MSTKKELTTEELKCNLQLKLNDDGLCTVNFNTFGNLTGLWRTRSHLEGDHNFGMWIVK
jgi:hypothetical protein